MGKTAIERLNAPKQHKVTVLHTDFAGMKKGQKMLVGTPKMVDDYILRIPRGETRSIERMRNEMARRRKCNTMCPVSTAIFVRIAAQAALERLEGGTPLSDVSPFWRLVAPDSKAAKRLNVDSAWIATQRAAEQSTGSDTAKK